MGRLFGTDGVRGLVGEELSCELAVKLGRATAYALTKHEGTTPNILIGKDTRVSGFALESAFVAGACSMGANCHLTGVIPTPAVSLLVVKYNFQAGVMVSASHNPCEFNGIKIFNKCGFKISDEMEQEIEEYVFNSSNITASYMGMCFFCKDAVSDYVSYIASTVEGFNFDGIRVAVDCANGSASATAKEIFNKINVEADILNAEPNGVNINKNCGSTSTEIFSKYVKENGYDIGVAFDGDADRCLAIDEKGNLIDGDQLIAIFARCMKDDGVLSNNTVVVTVMSNLGFFNFAKENNINLKVTQVGDRYVLKNMIENGYKIGGEQSGHIIFKDYSNTGDGQLTAVQLIKYLKNSGKSFAELAGVMKKFPQVMVSVKANSEQKQKYFNSQDIESYIQKKEQILGNESRILVRCSGTEPIIRIMIEGPDRDLIEKTSKEVANRISKLVGV